MVIYKNYRSLHQFFGNEIVSYDNLTNFQWQHCNMQMIQKMIGPVDGEEKRRYGTFQLSVESVCSQCILLKENTGRNKESKLRSDTDGCMDIHHLFQRRDCLHMNYKDEDRERDETGNKGEPKFPRTSFLSRNSAAAVPAFSRQSKSNKISNFLSFRIFFMQIGFQLTVFSRHPKLNGKCFVCLEWPPFSWLNDDSFIIRAARERRDAAVTRRRATHISAGGKAMGWPMELSGHGRLDRVLRWNSNRGQVNALYI